MSWTLPPLSRDQLVLFSDRLDDVIPKDHPVRLVDEIMSRIDWAPWEARYHGRLGQPAIHPRVLASVLLYGILVKIRASRTLEESLHIRLDFKWLASNRSIDHTTLSEFRRRFAAELKDLFVQIGLIAQSLDVLSLQQLAFDGTRMRANNRRRGSRTPDELRKAKQELQEKFDQMRALAEKEDAQGEVLASGRRLPDELADTERRLARVDAALAEIARLEEAGETPPARLPTTDPESRILPNKEGGFAPNYTPLATVDVASGMIVASDVIAGSDEEHHLAAAVLEVQEDFGQEEPSPEMLADGLMATGATLAAMDELNVTLYSPVPIADPQNPALRDDPSKPVPAEAWDRLPQKPARSRNGEKRPQLTKEAFVYDAEKNVYFCPQGEKLEPVHTTSERSKTGRTTRTRYKAPASACANCPLRDLCLQQGARRREISRDQHEPLREDLARRMATPEGQAKYALRSQAERPFAVIKQQFGARRFLLRGLEKVKTEWRWLTAAYNLTQLMTHLRSRAGPCPAPSPRPLTCVS